MSFDVVVIGSCMIDLVSYTPRFPKPGETLHGHRFSKGFGGKGANQCVVSARLGAKCAMVAKVGEDTFGSDYIENFKNNGIDTEFVYTTGEASTGVAPITVDDAGQNAIVIIAGANLLLTTDEVLKADQIIRSAKVAVFQLEISMESTLSGLHLAKKHGVRTIVNPAPAQETLPDEIYALSDIFCPNETEAEILTGVSVKSLVDAESAIEILLSRGCSAVIITMGELGAVYGTKNLVKPIHIPASKVNPVDSTGAGDAFVGALAYNLSKYSEMDMEEAIEKSSKIATMSVQKHGTQTSYPYAKDLSSSFL